LTVDGEDIWPQVMSAFMAELKAKDAPEWDIATIESLQMIPNGYLQYFYYPHKKLAAQQDWPPSRAETVMEIEADLLAQYAEPERSEPPADLMKRGGAYYSTTATQLLSAHYHDSGETHVVNTPQRNAVAGWPADWVLELPCKIGKSGAELLPAKPLPPACFGLLAQVKAYEILTVEAAVHGDRQAAYQALLGHPLGPTADKVQEVLEDMLGVNEGYLGRGTWDVARGT
jgi:6-phospho-beta-glucosidase